MNIIIIGDKYQKGMKSKGCPALIPINQRTNILQNQYRVLKHLFPESDITYISGFEYKKIQYFLNEHKEINIKLVINNNFNHGYEIDALNTIIDDLNDDTIIISGYHILNKKIFKNFNTLLGSQIFVSISKPKEIGCIIHNNTVKNIGFDLSNSISNIYYITRKDMNSVKTYIENDKFRNYFLFEIINNLIDQSVIFKPYFITSEILYDK